MKYIDADELIAEIDRQKIGYNADGKHTAECATCRRILDIIARQRMYKEQPVERPEYGYLSTTYIHGTKPRWDVGDTLAYYLCTSDEECEIVIGKIAKVEFDDEEGWVYTFEDENATGFNLVELWDELSLVEQEVYKIREREKEK